MSNPVIVGAWSKCPPSSPSSSSGLGLAFVLGTLAQRLKLPPLVGYLLAGVVVGPFTPGFVADPHLTLQLADIGVILLMFGVGLHFSPKDLLAVKAIAVPGAILQMALVTVWAGLRRRLFGWPWRGIGVRPVPVGGLHRGGDARLAGPPLDGQERGRIAIGWLVVQDLLTVWCWWCCRRWPRRSKGGAVDGRRWRWRLALTFGKLALFAGLMLVVGRRVIPAILHYIAHTGSRELFRLAVLSVALGVAFAAAELFGVSIALGAFLAGMILSGSPLSASAPPRNRCRCATPSRCCSSSRSACCSIRA